MSDDLFTAPGKDDFSFGSTLALMFSYCFQKVESLAPDREHRFYTECKFCAGTDSNRKLGQRPSISGVDHSESCELAKHFPRLKAMMNRDVT
jgi:hypothetical protein